MAALEPGVVVDADAGEESDFLPAQARYAPVAAKGGQAGLLGVSLARREARNLQASSRSSMS